MSTTLSENGKNFQNKQALFHRPSYLSTSPMHTLTPTPTHHHQAQWVTTWLMQLWILNGAQSTSVTNLATSVPLLGRYVFTVVRFTVKLPCSMVYRNICHPSLCSCNIVQCSKFTNTNKPTKTKHVTEHCTSTVMLTDDWSLYFR